MRDSVKVVAKLSGTAVIRWIVVFVPGMILSILCFFIAIFLISNNSGSGFSGAGHSDPLGATLGLIVLFSEDFWVMLLLTLSLIVFPVVYFIVANKLAIQSAIYSVWENKMQGWFSDKISSYSDKVLNKKN